MDVAWTAAVCHDRRRAFVYHSFIYALATCLLFSYAGGVTMHIAIGEAPPVLRSNVALLASAATWFVMFFTPLRHLYNFFPVKMVLVALQAICWQRCVCFGVDLGISRFPNSFVTPVLLAIFAGSAGGVLMNLEKRFFGMDGGTSTLGVKLSLLSGLVYYSQHPAALSHGILAPSLSLDDTKVLVGAVLVGWSIVAELWGPINPFAAVEAVFGSVFLAGNDEQATTWRSAGPAAQQRAAGSGKPRPKSRNQEKQQHSTDDEAHDDYGGSPAAAATLRNRKKRK